MMTMTRSEDRVIVQTYADGDDAPSEVRHRWQLAGMGSPAGTPGLPRTGEPTRWPTRRAPPSYGTVIRFSSRIHLALDAGADTCEDANTQRLGANRKARNRPWPDTDSTDRFPAASSSATPTPTRPGGTTPTVSWCGDIGEANLTDQDAARSACSSSSRTSRPAGAQLLTTREHVNVWRR